MKVTLNRNSWHRRLQAYVLKINTAHYDDFPNLCPYFWLTIFCMAVVPFVWLWRTPVQIAAVIAVSLFKVLGDVMDMAVDLIAGPINEYICQPLDKAFIEPRIKALEPDRIVKLWESGKEKDTVLFNRWRETMGYKTEGDLWGDLEKWRKEARERRHALVQEKEAAANALQRKLWEAEQEAKAARKARQEKLMRIAKATEFYAPYVLLTIGGCVLILLAPVLYTVGAWVVGLPWGSIGYGAFWLIKWVGIVAVVVVVVGGTGVFLWMVLKRVFGKCWLLLAVPFQHPKIKRANRRIGTVLGQIFVPIGRGLGKIGMGFADAFSLLKQYVKATKDGYCPQIEWKDTK